MGGMNNVLDPDLLEVNVKFAAVFILCYEALKDFVISKPRAFYCDPYTNDCKEGKESEEYKESVRALSENIEDASLKWFVNQSVITMTDYERYDEIRKRRNSIVHELLSNLLVGISVSDMEMYLEMRKIYTRLDQWWINEIEIPISGEYEPGTYDEKSVIGMESLVMNIINEVLFGDEAAKEKYKRTLLDAVKKFI